MTKSIHFCLLLITLSILNVSYKGIEGVTPVQSMEELLKYIRGKVLERANDYRAKYNLELLKFNETMNGEAQDWAYYLSTVDIFEHNPRNKSFGENIIQLSEMANIGARSVDVMYSCIAYVNLNDDESKLYTEENIGTMTQLLWKSTSEIGVGVSENTSNQKYYIVVYFNPRGNIENMFSNNLPKFKQEDIDDGKNELKYFNLGEILISNSEKKISNFKLENDQVIETQDEKFNSNAEASGLSHAEANMIRNQVFKRSNFYRDKYNLPQFEIKQQMNDEAQKWANHVLSVLQFEHNPENKTYGENMTMIVPMNNIGSRVVDLWHSCIAYVNLNADENKLYTEQNIGVMTQLLWKLSTEIGVGVAKHEIRHDYVMVVYFNPKGNEGNKFSDNLPKFKQEDINEGRNELKFFNLNKLLISNSEKKIPMATMTGYNLKNYQDIRPREQALLTLDEKFDSNEDSEGLINAEASMIRNQVFKRSNFYRDKHNLPLFEIKKQMNTKAQQWANHLIPSPRLYHNPNNESYGENITLLKLKSNVGEKVVDLWHSCIAYVNVNDDESKLYAEQNIGAMTQLLWRSTTEIGVGVALNTEKQFYIVVVYFNPKGNEQHMFSNNLPEFKQEDIDEGKNELKFFNLSRVFVSNSEKIIPHYQLKDYQGIGTRQPVLSKLHEKFNSMRNPVGLSYAEASRIRNQVLIRSNFYRAKYNLILFEITEQQNDEAQLRANFLALYGPEIEHEKNLTYGKIEYLTHTTIFGDIGEIAVDEWYNDISNVPEIMTEEYFQNNSGCLTQLLWKESVEIGVGVAISVKDRRYFIVVYFNTKGNIPEYCSKSLPKFRQEDIDLGKEAKIQYSELMRFSTYMRSIINVKDSDQKIKH